MEDAMKDLAVFSDKDLREELARREEARRLDEEAKRQARAFAVGANIDALLALVPDHQRTSCSDKNPTNAERARCTRCVLLLTEKYGSLPERFDLSVEVTTRPESP